MNLDDIEATSLCSGHAGERTVPVEFVAATGGSDRLTWGQRQIWEVLAWCPAEERWMLNISQVVPLPAGTAPERVFAAVRALVERHESLRTTFRAGSDGEPMQTVHKAGRLAVVVRDCTDGEQPQQVVRELSDRLRRTPFASADELPIRLALVTGPAGDSGKLVIGMSHLATDMPSNGVLVEELGELLAGSCPALPLAQQPLQRRRFEASEAGRRTSRRSLEHWRRWLCETPAAMLEAPSGAGAQTADAAVIISTAMATAVRRLASRAQTSTSSVLLSMAALVLGGRLGTGSCGIRVLVGTRFRGNTRRFVGPINQNAAFLTEYSGEQEVTAYLRQAAGTALHCYSRSECDPIALDELTARVAAERGLAIGQFCFFNDLRTTSAASGTGPDGPAGKLGGSLADTVVAGIPAKPAKGSNFMLTLIDLSATARVSLTTNLGFLPDGAARFLTDLELALVVAADGATRVGDVITTARRPV